MAPAFKQLYVPAQRHRQNHLGSRLGAPAPFVTQLCGPTQKRWQNFLASFLGLHRSTGTSLYAVLWAHTKMLAECLS